MANSQLCRSGLHYMSDNSCLNDGWVIALLWIFVLFHVCFWQFFWPALWFEYLDTLINDHADIITVCASPPPQCFNVLLPCGPYPPLPSLSTYTASLTHISIFLKHIDTHTGTAPPHPLHTHTYTLPTYWHTLWHCLFEIFLLCQISKSHQWAQN